MKQRVPKSTQAASPHVPLAVSLRPYSQTRRRLVEGLERERGPASHNKCVYDLTLSRPCSNYQLLTASRHKNSKIQRAEIFTCPTSFFLSSGSLFVKIKMRRQYTQAFCDYSSFCASCATIIILKGIVVIV